jgi:hypothetical protein
MSTCNCGPRGHGPECTAQAGEISRLSEQVRELKNGVGATTERWEMGKYAQMVYERHDYKQGYWEQKFGFRVGDRIWWVGVEGYGHDEEQSKKDKGTCREIVRRLNADPEPGE